ncbi:hypothetical protein, partial [Acidithiobacillus caldus]|uniref:hypothetical protein n=1 Tax=Acidithiobacillus caldus TaxID=33059 RepID=UPI001C07B721
RFTPTLFGLFRGQRTPMPWGWAILAPRILQVLTRSAVTEMPLEHRAKVSSFSRGRTGRDCRQRATTRRSGHQKSL